MYDLHQEHHFEFAICDHLGRHGWLYAEGDAALYDKHNALFLPDLLTWVEATQPDSWQQLSKTHGANLPKVLAERVRKCLNEQGTLEVLRRGVEMVGLKKPLLLVQFKPALGINQAIQHAYAANRLRVVRQVRHSLNQAQDALDLVLFVNGIAVATAELKSDFTQCVGDAVDQYRFDRNPAPKGELVEPLLAFPGGALVHFAVSQSEVMMSTRLAGTATQFLPFNRGNAGGAGNAPNPFGFATHYLWQEVWQRDSWLEILGRYLIGKRNDKKQLSSLIFPRYHQLDATRKLVADVLEKGAGQRYLIQHSAGSGKTNSIAWTAHFLADLHDADNRKIFDSVLVVSDRNVLDAQLQEAIFDFQRTTGVVATITDEKGGGGGDGLPQAFHVYSMRQAIEEGFILDVLQNYTTYKLAFRLANDGQEYDETQVSKSEALKGIMQWVRLHPYNISQKVQTVVEHFRDNVQPLLEGKAKAMIVVSSRKEAVRWQKAIAAYIARQHYDLGVLVAFSGEVDDPESYAEPVTEASTLLNPGLKGKDIREAFAEPDYHLLLVANKFQTGFDQPLLCGMYVDKRLGGVQAVQTLSRLNRAYPGKDTTYILDFVNEAEDVLAAFKTYYETAQLEACTDPNLVFALRAKLDASGFYDSFEVDRVAQVEMDAKGTQAQLSQALAPVADRLLKRYKVAQNAKGIAEANGDEAATQVAKDAMAVLLLFKGDMGAFNRLYAFLSQIFDYGNTDIEKRFIFYKRLLPLLDFGRERESVDLSKVVLTHHTLRDKGRQALNLKDGEAAKLAPMTETGSGSVQDKEKALLAEIIQKVNGLFEGELSDNDQLVYLNGAIKGKLLENDTLVQQAANNSKEQFANSPDLSQAILHAIMDALEVHTSMSSQALNSPRIQEGLKDTLLGPAQLYEALRAQALSRAARYPL